MDPIPSSGRRARLWSREWGDPQEGDPTEPTAEARQALEHFSRLDVAVPGLDFTIEGPRLDLSGHGLDDGSLATLASSPALQMVRVLDLSGNRLTARGMEVLAATPHAKWLTALDVSGNPIGDEGLAWLPTKYLLWSLTWLGVRSCGTTEAGWSDFARRRPPKIATLLGDRVPRLDFPVWRQLAELYGDGLYANATFATPHPYPFPPQSLVVFDQVPDGHPPHFTGSMLLSDYIQHHSRVQDDHAHYHFDPRRPAATRRAAGSITAPLARFDALVDEFRGITGPVHRPCAEFFDVAEAGCALQGFWCSFCRRTYDRDTLAGPDVDPCWAYCPDLHQLRPLARLHTCGHYEVLAPDLPLGSRPPSLDDYRRSREFHAWSSARRRRD